MKYYSTNRRTPEVSLREAVVASMAPDNGLYMPERIERLPDAFFDGIARLDLHRIAGRVADAFFGEEIEPETLRRIVRDTFCFDIPAVRVDDGIWALELFHGPTMAFKDVGARFMARILSHFIEGRDDEHPVTVLVATSGDTGGAVANGFLGVEGIDVVVLYPKGRVSDIQEKQFTTLGRNVTALEIEGTFDDCQRLVKSAFADTELKRRMRLTSANSINVARFLPQTFYFFHAYAQLRAQGVTSPIVVSVPSGNFGNLTAGLFARRMGLPVDRFIAANNANDTFYEYLRTGSYRPRPSVPTLANAMDVGDPNNFARILDLYGRSLDALRAAVGPDTAGLMLTNPNTVGIFDKNILEITKIIHDAGGLCYYDGANLNAVMGVVRPGDMGFDCIHSNLHKTFATPHGGGGPGAGAVGCKEFLKKYMPGPLVVKKDGKYGFAYPEKSIGRVKMFYGNFDVVVRALTYVLTLGKSGIREAAMNAVLNANYMRVRLKDTFTMAYDEICMHEFVMSLVDLHKETGVSALDLAKGMLDFGLHPPTMYFPLIVHEALMIEPCETESKETMDEVCGIYCKLFELAHSDPETLHTAPHSTPVRRLDEVGAARNMVLRYQFV